MRNRYFALRHGHSIANQRGIIVSHPDNGLGGYGLSGRGLAQVEAVIAATAFDREPLIVSSDFRRARETAEIAHGRLGCRAGLSFDARLRERHFGEFELGADRHYHEVWRRDEAGVEGGWRGVEGAGEVMARITSLIVDCETRNRGETFLLVSHGDVLQILQTAFVGEKAALHRRQPHLETAEIRELVLASAAS